MKDCANQRRSFGIYAMFLIRLFKLKDEHEVDCTHGMRSLASCYDSRDRIRDDVYATHGNSNIKPMIASYTEKIKAAVTEANHPEASLIVAILNQPYIDSETL